MDGLPVSSVSVRKRSAGTGLERKTSMKFIAAKSDLQSAVGIAVRAVPAHTTMTILECILIEAQGNDIRLTANDMELGIRTHLQGTVEVPGTVAVNAKMFSDIVRKLPQEIVEFESDGSNMIRIRSGKALFEIAGQSGDEFTEIPSVEQDRSITISQFSLKNLINQTIFSAAVNENNKIMTGELFEISGDILRVVALDGHRIAIRKIALKESSEPIKVIVPAKTLNEISRILPGEMDDVVTIFFARNHIVFEIPGTKVVSRLIDGEYFNVNQMISTDYETRVTVRKNEFLSCIDRASLFVREGDKKPIIFDIEDQEMKLSIDSPLGSMNEEIDTEKEGRDLAIGFNPKFLMDALKAIDDENVTLYFMNPKAPCFIRDEGDNYVYLILPVNFIR